MTTKDTGTRMLSIEGTAPQPSSQPCKTCGATWSEADATGGQVLMMDHDERSDWSCWKHEEIRYQVQQEQRRILVESLRNPYVGLVMLGIDPVQFAHAVLEEAAKRLPAKGNA